MTPRREAGFALVSVLAVILTLSLLAGGLVLLARNQAQSSVAGELRRKAIESADAAILRTILGLSAMRPEARWGYSGAPIPVETPAGGALVTVSDELGRIDLNMGDDRLLQSVFETGGLQPAAAVAMVDRVRDWSDEDDLRRLNGAEEADYRALGLRTQPRNRAFELVDELMLVPGMEQSLFDKIAPALTVYSWRRTVDQQKAQGIARTALGIDEPGDAPDPDLKVVGALGGRSLRIRAEVKIGVAGTLSREAVIRFTDDPRDPFWRQSWLDAPPSPGIDGDR